MKFSIYMNPQTRGPEQDVALIEDNIRQVVRVTDAGFVGVVLTEHHFSEYNTYGDNIMMAAHLAGLTRPGTKFLLAAVIPPLHNPMRLAQQLNLLDVVTKGNAIVGLGSGGSPVEFAGLGREPKNRYEDMEQVVEAMRRVMLKDKSDPSLEWQTRFESGVVHTRIMPTAYHRSMPPFARAAVSDDGARLAGEAGVFLFTGRVTLEELVERMGIYRAGLEQAGLPESEIEERLDWSFCQKQVIVARSDEEAREEAFRRIQLLDEYNAALQAHVRDLEQSDRMTPIVTVGNTQPDVFFAKAFITGTPETVRKELQRYVDAGIRHLALYFNFSFMTAEEADRSLDLFMDEVYPHFAPDVLDPATA